MDAGAEEEFRRFVQARWHALVRTAYLLTGDRGRAEDLVQQTLVKVHRRWSHIASAESPYAYTRAALGPRGIPTAADGWPAALASGLGWRRPRQPPRQPRGRGTPPAGSA